MPGRKLLPHPALIALALSLLLVVGLAGAALAHEHREVGPYEMVVGWRIEPALVDQPNGLDLRVALHVEEGSEEEGAPIEGLEETLQAEVIYGDQTMPLDLRAAFGRPGAYTADVIPTVPGSYIFRIFGTIEGTEVDESFNSADGEFSDIGALEALQFPSSTATDEPAMVASAQEVNNARLFGIAGTILGALGLIMGGLALARR